QLSDLVIVGLRRSTAASPSFSTIRTNTEQRRRLWLGRKTTGGCGEKTTSAIQWSWYTVRPPTTVRRTRVLVNWSAGTLLRSFERTTKSAYSPCLSSPF